MPNSTNKKQPTMVILRALALGDFFTGLPALRALSRAFPDHRRFLTCPGWLKPIVQMTGVADVLIDGAVFNESAGKAGQYRVPTDLQERIKLEQAQLNGLKGAPYEPDIAVNLRGQRIALHEALLALKPHRFIGFYNPDVPASKGGPIWHPEEYEVVRYCRLLQENGIPADPRDLHIDPPNITVPDYIRGATVIHPGAGSPARCWPVERWVAVAQWELERGNRVIITGGPHEVDLSMKLAALTGLPPDSIFSGRTDIMELCALVSASGKVICADTGIAHLAVAFSTPSVVIKGPEPPTRFGPPPHLPIHRALWAGMKGDTYTDTPDPGLLKIQVEDVFKEILSLERDLPWP